jgi:hypothetical protein
MKKKVIFIGLVLVALVLTSGTFAYTYTNNTTTLPATLADDAWTTYEKSLNQPDWDSVLPEGGTTSVNLAPIAPGDYTTIIAQEPSTGEHWELVDEQPADTTTYVSTYGSSVWQGDLYQTADLPVGITTINSVTVHAVIAAAGAWSIDAMTELLTNGQQFSGDTVSTSGTSWTGMSTAYDVNPDTGEAWTAEEINNLQVGITLKGPRNNRAALCTQVYISISYEAEGVIQGDVPEGSLFVITPHPQYPGDLTVKLYLTNTADLLKAYQYLNIKIYVSGSVEAGGTPNYKLLSMENGVVEFSILGGSVPQSVIYVTGGSYGLVSSDPSNWGAGYTLVPEFYCEISQR